MSPFALGRRGLRSIADILPADLSSRDYEAGLSWLSCDARRDLGGDKMYVNEWMCRGCQMDAGEGALNAKSGMG